eukprot:Hpha_TRINITY_DN25862_c0_g1::TRINITY_DN25862_c0_g1_i1::g.19956::m.19956/K10420/DYNLT; dynein light chain Tctex-type 1
MAAQDELRAVVAQVVGSIFHETLQYSHQKCDQLATQIVEKCSTSLGQKGEKKYIVTCTMFQKTGAGCQTKVACHWDADQDASFQHRVENKSVVCVTQAFAVSY